MNTIIDQEDCNTILIKCDCGCTGLEIDKFIDNDGIIDYNISYYIDSFLVDQKGIFSELIKRIKIASIILFKGTYKFNEISINQEKFNKLSKAINYL